MSGLITSNKDVTTNLSFTVTIDLTVIANKYHVTVAGCQALLTALDFFAQSVRPDNTVSYFSAINTALRNDGLGALCCMDYVFELKLTDLGKLVANELTSTKYPQDVYLNVIASATPMF